jgi:hypothetical protein
MAAPNTPAKKKLVRIRPSSPREVYVFQGFYFKREDGWVEVPAAVARACEDETTNELNPTAGEPIFDVKDVDEAAKIAELEKKRVEPAGTPDKPKQPQRTPEAKPEAKRNKRPEE